VVAKVVNKIIFNRLQPKIDVYLRPNQNGVRPGKTTTPTSTEGNPEVV